jgi:hypothetical protein
MTWNNVKKYIENDPIELIEAYFHGMTDESWGKLFSWASDKVVLLDCHHGRLKNSELNLDSFLKGELSYVADVEVSDGYRLSLSIIEDDELTIDIEKCDIDTEEKFDLFLKSIITIAAVIECRDYVISPEFKKDEAFVVNGKMV